MTLRQTGLKNASHWPHKCHDMMWDSKKDCVYSAMFGIVPKHLLECNIGLETVWLCCFDWFAYGKKINLVRCSVVFPRHINQIKAVTSSPFLYCTTKDTWEQCQTLLSKYNPFWNLPFISVMMWYSKKDCACSTMFGTFPKNLLKCNIGLEMVWLCCSDWFARRNIIFK